MFIQVLDKHAPIPYEGSVVRDQLYSHLCTNNLLSSCQSGCCLGHLTSTTLLYVINECYKSLKSVCGSSFLRHMHFKGF